jgi:hypothetical protein
MATAWNLYSAFVLVVITNEPLELVMWFFYGDRPQICLQILYSVLFRLYERITSMEMVWNFDIMFNAF